MNASTGGNSDKKPPIAAHDQHQRQHEKKVIDTEQNVLDADFGIGRDDFKRTGTADKRYAGMYRQEARDLFRAVQALIAQEHVDAVICQRCTLDPDA